MDSKKEGKWVSVMDYMPDYGQTVLVLHEYAPNDISLDYVDVDEFGNKYFANENHVTHWYPVPSFESEK